EGSRVALLYILGLGAGASVLTGDLVNVDLALMVMPRRVRRACELVSAALVSAFGFMLIPGAWTFTESGAMQTSPVLRVRMDSVFASTLCFAVLLAIFGLVKFIEVLLGVADPELPKHQAGEV
ncbi:MAG: TRAP transporter small permease subunit, partial [Propionivibrio sp.]